jgi:hypothetical protein
LLFLPFSQERATFLSSVRRRMVSRSSLIKPSSALTTVAGEWRLFLHSHLLYRKYESQSKVHTSFEWRTWGFFVSYPMAMNVTFTYSGISFVGKPGSRKHLTVSKWLEGLWAP